MFLLHITPLPSGREELHLVIGQSEYAPPPSLYNYSLTSFIRTSWCPLKCVHNVNHMDYWIISDRKVCQKLVRGICPLHIKKRGWMKSDCIMIILSKRCSHFSITNSHRTRNATRHVTQWFITHWRSPAVTPGHWLHMHVRTAKGKSSPTPELATSNTCR